MNPDLKFQKLNTIKELEIQQDLGWFIEDESSIVLFGNKNLTPKELDKLLSALDLSHEFILQKHTSQILPSPSKDAICDGIYTKNEKSALCIRTADCIPLMISTPSEIYALHCGRKGLIDGIFNEFHKTFKELNQKTPSSINFYIGPHIHQESYEIGQNLFNELQSSFHFLDPSMFLEKNGKYYLGLSSFLHQQITSDFPQANTFELEIDTLCDENYYSYRRDSKTKHRNFSLIWKKAKN